MSDDEKLWEIAQANVAKDRSVNDRLLHPRVLQNNNYDYWRCPFPSCRQRMPEHCREYHLWKICRPAYLQRRISRVEEPSERSAIQSEEKKQLEDILSRFDAQRDIREAMKSLIRVEEINRTETGAKRECWMQCMLEAQAAIVEAHRTVYSLFPVASKKRRKLR